MLVESDCATGSGFSWKWKKVETLQFSTEGGFPKGSCERSSEENSRGWGWSSRLQKDRAWTAVRISAFVLKWMGMTTERAVHGEATGSNLFQQDHSGCQAKNWLADSEESLPVVVKVQVEVQTHPETRGCVDSQPEDAGAPRQVPWRLAVQAFQCTCHPGWSVVTCMVLRLHLGIACPGSGSLTWHSLFSWGNLHPVTSWTGLQRFGTTLRSHLVASVTTS